MNPQVSPQLQSSLLSDLRGIIRQAQEQAYLTVNAIQLMTYWRVGQRIVLEEQQGKARAAYGTQLLTLLSQELSKDYPKGYTARDLRSYRQLYLYFSDLEIWHSRLPNLTWTHFRLLLRVTDPDARQWYMLEASREMWSTRTLDRNIASQYYQRLLHTPKTEASQTDQATPICPKTPSSFTELFKSPVIAEFLQLPSPYEYSERELEKSIITHMKQFLLELGRGFAFVAEQQRIVTEDGEYYIDLVFYNFILKSFVLVDLKTARLTHQDLGQMDMYVRMYDDLCRTEGDQPTIGLLLCAETSRDMARYSILYDNPQLFAAKYLPYLPSEEELRHEIERQKEVFRLQQTSI